jgi:hypothetical protein
MTTKTAAPLPPPPRTTPEALKRASESVEQVSQKLWFLDLKFTEFATPRLIGFVFAAYLLLSVLAEVAVIFYALLNMPVIQATFGIVFEAIFLVFLAICFRVFLETFLVIFRIAEHLSYLRYLKKDDLEV